MTRNIHQLSGDCGAAYSASGIAQRVGTTTEESRKSRIQAMFKSLLAALFLCASPALAQQMCGATSIAYENLTTRYNESRAYSGIMSNGWIAELWTSPEGTFSVLVTGPNGKTCMIASGENGSAAPAPALAPNL